MIVLPEKREGQFLYVLLYQQLKRQIQEGQMPAGTKLLSKRAMAAKLGLSVNTVDAAYSQLEMEGFVEVRPKSGFYVCAIESLPRPEGPRAPRPQLPEIGGAGNVEIDFAPAAIAEEKFPFANWKKCLHNALERPEALKRTSPEGDLRLREAIAAYLYRERAVECGPEQVILGAGTDSLMELLSYILDDGCTLAVEDPVYNKAYRLFARMGHPVTPVGVDRQGVMAEPLEGLDQAVLYTTPSHQYPLGISMPMARRAQLLNWAGRGSFRYLIEDDYDSEFRYDARPVPSLQSIDGNGRVIYLSSFSRSLTPAMRLGVMVLPPDLLERYRQRWTGFPSRVSTLEQLALDEFLREGYFETHLNRMRTVYKNKCRRLLRGLQPLGPALRLVGELAGQHLTLAAENGMDEEELCRAALSAGVRVYPVSSFFIRQPEEKKMVLLGFGGLSDQQIDEGTRRLVRVWSGEKNF